MSLKDALLPEYDHEMGTTRRMLERVPDDDLGWKPHEKSYSIGQLAGHLANLPFWASAVLEEAIFDLASADTRPRDPPSTAANLTTFDANVKKARALLDQQTDASLLSPWTLKSGEHEIFTLPKIAALRTFVMNHTIHHRGQLSVYLRLRNVPVPAVYGPTADEG